MKIKEEIYAVERTMGVSKRDFTLHRRDKFELHLMNLKDVGVRLVSRYNFGKEDVYTLRFTPYTPSHMGEVNQARELNAHLADRCMQQIKIKANQIIQPQK